MFTGKTLKWWNVMWNRILRFILGLLPLAFAGQALGQSHALINASRPSTVPNVFVSQSLEGEYGFYNIIRAGGDEQSAMHQVWRGYGVRNAIGVELLKFMQFGVSHTMLNMRSKDNSLENLRGSRLAADAKFVFAAPIGNMEAGGGLIASDLDYQRMLDNADFLGSGYYYSLGLNYFFSSRVSFFAQGKAYRENHVRNGGKSSVENIKSDTSGFGIGFSFWL